MATYTKSEIEARANDRFEALNLAWNEGQVTDAEYEFRANEIETWKEENLARAAS